MIILTSTSEKYTSIVYSLIFVPENPRTYASIRFNKTYMHTSNVYNQSILSIYCTQSYRGPVQLDFRST